MNPIFRLTEIRLWLAGGSIQWW